MAQLTHVRICGLMGMATNTDEEELVRKEFHQMRLLFDELRGGLFQANPAFTQLSMGMSHDYPLAVAEGSTLVRVGTYIFGEREY